MGRVWGEEGGLVDTLGPFWTLSKETTFQLRPERRRASRGRVRGKNIAEGPEAEAILVSKGPRLTDTPASQHTAPRPPVSGGERQRGVYLWALSLLRSEACVCSEAARTSHGPSHSQGALGNAGTSWLLSEGQMSLQRDLLSLHHLLPETLL